MSVCRRDGTTCTGRSSNSCTGAYSKPSAGSRASRYDGDGCITPSTGSDDWRTGWRRTIRERGPSEEPLPY